MSTIHFQYYFENILYRNMLLYLKKETPMSFFGEEKVGVHSIELISLKYFNTIRI